MSNAQSEGEKLFARCFTEEQHNFLKTQPEFLERTGRIESLSEAIEAVELGDKLLRQHWKSEGGTDGEEPARTSERQTTPS